jgi:hypothetical protein
MSQYSILLQNGDIQTDLVANVAQNIPGVLNPGCCIYAPQQAFRLSLQATDGNLVLEAVVDRTLPGANATPQPASAFQWLPLWSTATAFNQTGSLLTMQVGGNLVLLNSQGEPVFNSVTNGHQGAFLRMQDDGNLVIYTIAGTAIWATNTFAGTEGRPGAGLL